MTDRPTPNSSSHDGIHPVGHVLRPRSVAIVGISSRPGSAGHNALANLTLNGFAGDIHLVGRSGGDIDGRPVLRSADELPEGVDLAIFTLPAEAVLDAVAACGRRKVGAAVIFASGFAEIGETGQQDEIARVAREHGVALVGPNCLGLTNFVDRIPVGFAGARAIPPRPKTDDPAIAIVSHSGGLMAHILLALNARDIPISYMVSTGNEAGLGLHDFIDYLADDETTRGIVVYAEEVREPHAFLAAATRAEAVGKPVLMIHPGRGARSKRAIQSHTGALAGDYAAMRVTVQRSGILLVDTLEELLDCAEIMVRFPGLPVKGTGILTFSGAFCAIAFDVCDDLGLDIPTLSPDIAARLAPELPAFAPPKNPLDLATLTIWRPELFGMGAKALLDDPEIGSLLVSIPVGGPPSQGLSLIDALSKVLEGNGKPLVFSVFGDGAPLAPEFLEGLRERRIIHSRSPERSLRAIAKVTEHGRLAARARTESGDRPFDGLPALGDGPQPEWLCKTLLQTIGLRTPDGALAQTLEEAVAIAERIGFPVAMKAQAGTLAHKTEAGAVRLNIRDADAVAETWRSLVDNVARTNPGLMLDGILVEAMAEPGVELVVGARRDPRWGPVVMVGAGGTLVEAIGDVRLMPPDLAGDAIAEELRGLKIARLLDGFRGAPPADLAAIVRTIELVGRLIRTETRIVEIDINPLVASPAGAIALDALIVTQG